MKLELSTDLVKFHNARRCSVFGMRLGWGGSARSGGGGSLEDNRHLGHGLLLQLGLLKLLPRGRGVLSHFVFGRPVAGGPGVWM